MKLKNTSNHKKDKKGKFMISVTINRINKISNSFFTYISDIKVFLIVNILPLQFV